MKAFEMKFKYSLSLGTMALVSLLAGCGSAPRIKITSVPEAASVSIRGADGSIKSIGKTPLDIDRRELGSGSRLAIIEVAQEGYQDQLIMLARDRTNENYDISLRLKKVFEDPKSIDAKARQEKLARSVAQAYNLINNKRFNEARLLLNTLIVEYPNVSVGFDLMGGLAYLEKDLKAALGFYERSLVINSENIETQQIVARLRAMVQ